MYGNTIRLQTVLYGNEALSIERSLESIDTAAQELKKSGDYAVSVAYGDASRRRLFTDEDIESFNDKFKNIAVSYRFFDENTGTARGHNLLAEGITGGFLMLMNPDIVLMRDMLSEIIRPFLESKLSVGIAEGRQTPIEHPKDYDKKTGETSWASGACTFIPAKLFHEVGGYDEKTFFMYCDDVDLAWRVRLAGYSVIYQPSAVVYHSKLLSAEGGWQPTDAEKYYSAEAALLLAYKWSNNERVSELLSVFAQSGDENLIKAAREFERRKGIGELPEQLDPGHRAAEFLNGNYAVHRFVL